MRWKQFSATVTRSKARNLRSSVFLAYSDASSETLKAARTRASVSPRACACSSCMVSRPSARFCSLSALAFFMAFRRARRTLSATPELLSSRTWLGSWPNLGRSFDLLYSPAVMMIMSPSSHPNPSRTAPRRLRVAVELHTRHHMKRRHNLGAARRLNGAFQSLIDRLLHHSGRSVEDRTRRVRSYLSSRAQAPRGSESTATARPT